MIDRRRTMISDYIPIQAIDLGLPSKTLWASGNLTKDIDDNYFIAENNESGAYFSYGDIIGHNVSGQNEKYDFGWTNYNNGVSGRGYSAPSGYTSGNVDYDCARAQLGYPWRVPTYYDYVELINNCTFVDGKTNNSLLTVIGPNGNKIYFPRGGYGNGTLIYSIADGGYYGCSTQNSETKSSRFQVYNGGHSINGGLDKCFGFMIRPVC